MEIWIGSGLWLVYFISLMFKLGVSLIAVVKFPVGYGLRRCAGSVTETCTITRSTLSLHFSARRIDCSNWHCCIADRSQHIVRCRP